MLGLENLRSNTEADVARLLDAAVHIDVTVVDNEEEEVGRHVVPKDCQSQFSNMYADVRA
jgi:hypothetical protein